MRGDATLDFALHETFDRLICRLFDNRTLRPA